MSGHVVIHLEQAAFFVCLKSAKRRVNLRSHVPIACELRGLCPTSSRRTAVARHFRDCPLVNFPLFIGPKSELKWR
jgi:hypothetical protein